mgnify:CR=1 FL=1
MTKSATREAADKVTFTQAEVTAGDTASRAGRKNLIINGSFQISQRGNYTSATGLTSSWTYYLDRFKARINNISGNLTHKVDQTVDGKLTDTVRLDATSTASGYINLLQQFEDLQKLKGQSVTFSAWVKSNTTNAKLVLHRDGSNAQTATTHTGGGGWELLTATVTLATTITHSVGLYCGILANATGNVSITSGDYFEMAFVQLELGSVATDFEHRSYGEELALCQRYFYQETTRHYRPSFLDGSGNYPTVFVEHPVPMRVTATGAFLQASDYYYNSSGSGDSNFIPNPSSVSWNGDNKGGSLRYNAISNGQGASNAMIVGIWYTRLKFDAEL